MFTQVLSPINEAAAAATVPEGEASSSCCIHRLFHYGAITLLSISTAFLFVQTQAISLRLASQQREIESLHSQLQSTSQHIEHEVEQAKDLTLLHMAGTFTLLTCLLTLFHMTSHLRSLSQPSVQRKVLAILWMSPVYSVTSFLCLVLPDSAEGYLMIVKDFYESYVIYTFLSFLIAVLGRGDREKAVATLRRTGHLRRPYKWLGCLFHPSPEDSEEALARAVLMECQLLGMQFVFLNSVIAVMDFVLDLLDGEDGDNEEKSSLAFFYSPKFMLLMIRNVSVFLAFSGLLKFYHAVSDELAWCQPFNKFLTIKGVVFMTFWQGLAIKIFFHFNSHKNNSQSANSIQHILICMEMLFFSIAHWCVFPADEWQDGYKVQYYEGPGFGFKDFASDVSLIIDDGKRSMRARREMKKNGAESSCLDANGSVSTSGLSLNGGRESPSFGSVDDTVKYDEESEAMSSTRPLV